MSLLCNGLAGMPIVGIPADQTSQQRRYTVNIWNLAHWKSNRVLFWDISHTHLKLPSLFATWLFLTFHNKLHIMKALVILHHSWSPFLPLTCLYGKNELLWVSVWHSIVFSLEKTPPRLLMQITWLWPLLGRFSHSLIAVRQTKKWTLLDLFGSWLFTFYSVHANESTWHWQ